MNVKQLIEPWSSRVKPQWVILSTIKLRPSMSIWTAVSGIYNKQSNKVECFVDVWGGGNFTPLSLQTIDWHWHWLHVSHPCVKNKDGKNFLQLCRSPLCGVVAPEADLIIPRGNMCLSCDLMFLYPASTECGTLRRCFQSANRRTTKVVVLMQCACFMCE